MNSEARPRVSRLLRGLRLVAFLMLGLAWAVALGGPMLVSALGGAWDEATPSWEEQLSPRAQELLEQAYQGIDLERRLDTHVHVAGIGTGDSGCRVNPRMRSMLHPVEFSRFQLYLSAAGVEDLERADQEFVERLDQLTASLRPGGRFALLAFDAHHDADGGVDDEATEFLVPNEYIWELCQRFPERYVPVISVHPYRPDARELVAHWGERGVRMMKWLPNAMGIDPASPLCDGVYEEMAAQGMLLLSHTGAELAVEAEEDQELGNPLRLRRALDHGVRVIAAHCATLGTNVDLDDPQGAEVSSFDLFLRLMDEERYEGLLYGELSGVTLMTRVGPVLETLLERQDLHARFLDGSDYPLPAMNVAISLGRLIDQGFVDPADEAPLTELYRAHPLAFDLVLKRTLRAPEGRERFDPRAFEVPLELGF